MKLCGLCAPRVSLGRARAVQGRATSTKLPTESWGPQTSNQALTTTVLRTQRDATRHGEQWSGSGFGPHATLRRGHIRWARVRAPPYRALQVFSCLCSARRSGGQSQAGHARAATLSWIPLYLLSLSLFFFEHTDYIRTKDHSTSLHGSL
jgi:hypothetical protein